jgi:hypothetical protein
MIGSSVLRVYIYFHTAEGAIKLAEVDSLVKKKGCGKFFLPNNWTTSLGRQAARGTIGITQFAFRFTYSEGQIAAHPIATVSCLLAFSPHACLLPAFGSRLPWRSLSTTPSLSTKFSSEHRTLALTSGRCHALSVESLLSTLSLNNPNPKP